MKKSPPLQAKLPLTAEPTAGEGKKERTDSTIPNKGKGERAQPANVLPAKSYDLSSLHGTHKAKGKNPVPHAVR